MTDTLKHRIWQWLPARRSRRRQSIPTVCAIALGASDDEIRQAWSEMLHDGQIFRDQSGFHRGWEPLIEPDEREESKLW